MIKLLDRAKQRVLGIFHSLPRRRPGVAVDKKQLGRELAIPSGATEGAQDGDLVSVETHRSARAGLTSGRVRERLGSLNNERAISEIAIHAHGVPYVFPPEVLAEADTKEAAGLQGREDWRTLP